MSMKSVLTTSNLIHFNSELNEVLRFINTHYSEGTHISEEPVVITSIDKGHPKCDCVNSSIVKGVREQILLNFSPNAPPGYKIMKEPFTGLYKTINKTRLDKIQIFLEDTNYDPVKFKQRISNIHNSNHQDLIYLRGLEKRILVSSK